MLSEHRGDERLGEPGSTATWKIEGGTTVAGGVRHIRIQQYGRNASAQTHYLSLSGFEIYGTATGVCEELGKAAKEAEKAAATSAQFTAEILADEIWTKKKFK